VNVRTARPSCQPLPPRDARGDDLLREHVQRRRGLRRAIEIARADRAAAGRRFDELVTVSGKQSPLGQLADRVTRSADALEERRDRARRADLDRQVDLADVDAQLQRRRRDERAEAAGLQPVLGVEPALASRGCCGGT
jgi:hypothetical protein